MPPCPRRARKNEKCLQAPACQTREIGQPFTAGARPEASGGLRVVRLENRLDLGPHFKLLRANARPQPRYDFRSCKPMLHMGQSHK